MTVVPASEDWTDEASASLFQAILALESTDEAERFLRDLCTRRELSDMAHRWEIARLLVRGHSYRQIAEEANTSTATVTRINEWLQHGRGGYRLLLERLGLMPDEEDA